MSAFASLPSGTMLASVAIWYSIVALISVLALAGQVPLLLAWTLDAQRLTGAVALTHQKRPRLLVGMQWSMIVAVVVHIAALGWEGLSAHRSPLSNTGATLLLLSALSAIVYVVIERVERFVLLRGGSWVAVFVAAASGIVGATDDQQASILPLSAGDARALWLQASSLTELTCAVLLVLAATCAASLLALPSARVTASARELLDEWGYRLILWCSPPAVLAVLCHVLWAQVIGGVSWLNSSGEAWAIIAAVFCALLVHVHSFLEWRGRRIAYLALAGIVLAIFPLAAGQG